MSRVGKLPIQVPSGVTITVDDALITVAGPKGTLTESMQPGVNVKQEGSEIIVSRQTDEREHRAKHGLVRALVNNMVIGVTKGFEKKLEVNGVGFKIAMEGTKLKMALGFSHDVYYQPPQGVNVSVEANNIVVSGISKQQVGQVAAEIRSFKKPEPYKGKGIKYVDERIIRKSGKSGKD
ncbi:50S ribosomal protein L6 [Candidatus Nomurabacteria bacterium]|nr:50S ribosomal protein L6 [Candidatus Saccharibacteria bacterium]MCA9350716.1 50S ribosomal protein L6 [Candidatus Saccharibacteria bacterium]MCB9839841.1 50S ribosomal protein L6 [Candidatus Nomurabacteria bacterium]